VADWLSLVVLLLFCIAMVYGLFVSASLIPSCGA
jgi:hypothetical protein